MVYLCEQLFLQDKVESFYKLGNLLVRLRPLIVPTVMIASLLVRSLTVT